jgi:hypothetical protein
VPLRYEDIQHISSEWASAIPGGRKSMYGDTLGGPFMVRALPSSFDFGVVNEKVTKMNSNVREQFTSYRSFH